MDRLNAAAVLNFIASRGSGAKLAPRKDASVERGGRAAEIGETVRQSILRTRRGSAGLEGWRMTSRAHAFEIVPATRTGRCKSQLWGRWPRLMWTVLYPVAGVVSLPLWIGGLIAAQQSEVRDFRAVGTVGVKVLESGHVLQSYTNDFAVEASDVGFHIRVGGGRPGAPSLTEVETLFDGTNTYVYRRYDTNYPIRTIVVKQNGRYVEQPTKKPLHSKNSANVEIVAGQFPRSKDPASMLLWIAFAAHRYYKAQDDPLQPPVLLLGPAYEVGQLRLKTEWGFCRDKPGFLQRRVDYDNGGRYYLKEGKVTSAPREGALSAGYTNSCYKVNEWTNISQGCFPRHFTLRKYKPEDGAPAELEAHLVVEGWTATVERSTVAPMLTVAAQANVMVRDLRPGVGVEHQPFTYFSRSGTLEDPDTVRKRADYRRFRSSHAPREQGASHRWLAFVGVLVISLPLAVWVWRWNLRESVEIPNTEQSNRKL